MKMFAPAALALGICMAGSAQAPAPAPAPAPRPRMEEGRPRMMEHMARALHLTEAQKASIKDIHAKHQAALEGKRKAAGDTRRAFGEAVRKADTPAADLKKLHAAMADANLDLLLEHRAQRQEVHAVLTPEQREKAARLEGRMEGMRMRREGRHGRSGMDPMGLPGEDPR